MSQNDNIVVSENVQKTIKALIERILGSIESLSSNRSFITIGLSGGSLIEQLSGEIVNYLDKFKPHSQKLRFLFCDERFVPLDHKDSTYYGYKINKFFELLQIPDEHIYYIKANASSVEQCAVDYESRIKPLLNENNGFDILLLGIGPDGHTCSLFPDHKLFLEAKTQTQLVLPISDSPKPPPERVTLTLPFINNSNFLFFCAVGEGKADMLKRILKDADLTIPSANVRPNKNGKLVWFLDEPAGKSL